MSVLERVLKIVHTDGPRESPPERGNQLPTSPASRFLAISTSPDPETFNTRAGSL